MLDTEQVILQPRVTYHVRTREWELLADWEYFAREGRFCIASGFRMNLASIPKSMWWIVGPHELSIAAPLLHDFLYQYRGCVPFHGVTPYRFFTRAEADALFHGLMLREGVPRWKAGAAHRAVRIFGGAAWAKDDDHATESSFSVGRALLQDGVTLAGPQAFTVTLDGEYVDTYE